MYPPPYVEPLPVVTPPEPYVIVSGPPLDIVNPYVCQGSCGRVTANLTGTCTGCGNPGLHLCPSFTEAA